MKDTVTNKLPEVVVGVVVRHLPTGKVLITQRSKWSVWGTHGGHVESGETIAEAAVRETKEEVGMDTQFTKVIRYGESINPPTFHRKAHLIFFHCLVESDSDEVNIDKNEIVDYRWIYPSENRDYKISANTAETMKMLATHILSETET